VSARIGALANQVGSFLVAGLLVVTALLSPFLGFGASEYYEGRTFLWVVASDWLMAAGLLAGATCLATAARLVWSVARP